MSEIIHVLKSEYDLLVKTLGEAKDRVDEFVAKSKEMKEILDWLRSAKAEAEKSKDALYKENSDLKARLQKAEDRVKVISPDEVEFKRLRDLERNWAEVGFTKVIARAVAAEARAEKAEKDHESVFHQMEHYLGEQIADLNSRLTSIAAENGKMRDIGGMMSNLCFNGKQLDKIPEDFRLRMKSLQEDWDKITQSPAPVEAQSGTKPPAAPNPVIKCTCPDNSGSCEWCQKYLIEVNSEEPAKQKFEPLGARAAIREEMEARGWTSLDVARRMGGDVPLNLLCVDMYLAVNDKNLKIDREFATRLGIAFEVSPELFWNLDGFKTPPPADGEKPHLE